MAWSLASKRHRPVEDTAPESYDPKTDRPLPKASAFDAPSQDPLLRGWDDYRRWINSKYEGTGFEDPSLKQTGEVARTPSLRDALSSVMSGAAEKAGASPRDAQWAASKATPAAELAPGVGTAASQDAAAEAYGRGDYGTAAMEGLGGVPFAGHLLSAGAHALAPVAKAAMAPMARLLDRGTVDVAEDAAKVTRDTLAESLKDTANVGGLPKPPTKKALAEQAKARAAQRDQQTAIDRGFQPGENRQPYIMPSEQELGDIRSQHGGYGEGSNPEVLKETYVDPDIGDAGIPEPGPRTREQRDLPRKMTEVNSPRIQDLIDNPKVKQRIMEAARAGESVSQWYDTTPLGQMFHKEFGPEEGQKRFEDFIGFVAGTSTGNKIGPNIRTASNYYNQKYGGGRDIAAQPFLRKGKNESPAEFYEVPPEGYGSDKQQTHMYNVNKYATEGELSSMDNPKIAAFYENLLGNWQPTTIDKHAMRLGAMASGDPRFLTEQGQKAFTDMSAAGLDQNAVMEQLGQRATNWTDIPDTAKGEYDALEKYWNGIADEMGISPAQLQAQAWVGGGEQTGLGSPGITFMDAFKDRVRRTAIKNNIPPNQVIKLMMHGKLTLAELEGGGDQSSAVG